MLNEGLKQTKEKERRISPNCFCIFLKDDVVLWTMP